MPPVLPDPRTAAREAARAKLAGLFPGELLYLFADEIADAVLDAAAEWLIKKYGVTNRAAADLRHIAATPTAVCEIPHESVAEEDACEQRRLRDLPPGEFGDLVRKITPTT